MQPIDSNTEAIFLQALLKLLSWKFAFKICVNVNMCVYVCYIANTSSTGPIFIRDSKFIINEPVDVAWISDEVLSREPFENKLQTSTKFASKFNNVQTR